MTREEAAIKSCEDRIKHLKSAPTHHYGKRQRERAIELEKVKIKALRPVSREQVEKVFPGCPACKNGPPKLHIPAFRAMAVCNQHMDHEAFDIELNSKFCLNCGRPLTDKAVEMVMERWEALKDGKGG